MSFDALPGLDPALFPEGWLERLEAASWRGVPFFTMAEEFTFGRRLEVHEYADREKPHTEDVGRQADRWRIEAFVLGPDYDKDRDRLIAALREVGAGELVTQRFGTHRANIDTGRVRESGVEGRWAKITFDAVEAGVNLEPRESVATRSFVEALIGEAATGVLTEWVLGAQEVVGSAQEALTGRVAEGMNDAIDFAIEVQKNGPLTMAARTAALGIINQSALPGTGLLENPAGLGSQMIDVYLSLGKVEATVDAKLRHLEELRNLGRTFKHNLDGSPTTTEVPGGKLHGLPFLRHPDAVATPDHTAELANTAALSDMVRRSLVLAGARAGIDGELDSLEQTRDLRDRVLAPLDLEITIAADEVADDAYVRLRELRAAAETDFAVRGEQLPDLITFTPPNTTSSFLLAQRLYGSGAREGDVIDRVAPEHPGFIPGGQELRVLRS